MEGYGLVGWVGVWEGKVGRGKVHLDPYPYIIALCIR